jgi:hypothetical protein
VARRSYVYSVVLAALILSVLLFAPGPAARADEDPPPPGQGAQPQTQYKLYLPILSKPPCQNTGQSYGSISVIGEDPDRPAELNADINLTLRGYELTTGVYLGLVSYGPVSDSKAPQLYSLFGDNRTATFINAYRVHQWFWADPPDPGTRGPVIDDYPTTHIGMAVTPGELIRTPSSGYDIGGGFEVMVLYAEATRITLKYTREDNVKVGYTLHVEDLCVDSNLLALYHLRNSQGRDNLPALPAGQPFGRANGVELGVSIVDSGSFMDPRSRNDWWQGR